MVKIALVISRIRNIIVIMALAFVCLLAPVAAYADADLYSCEQNDDCVFVQGVCGMTPVNKTKADEAEKIFKHERTMAECAHGGPDFSAGPTAPALRCYNKKCETVHVYSCEKDDDCAVVLTECNWTAVNKNYFQKEKNTAVCSHEPYPKQSNNAHCSLGKCEIERFDTCTKDDDCTFVRGNCGSWLGVNKEKFKEADEYYNQFNKFEKCERTLDNQPKKIGCYHNRCEPKPDEKGCKIRINTQKTPHCCLVGCLVGTDGFCKENSATQGDCKY